VAEEAGADSIDCDLVRSRCEPQLWLPAPFIRVAASNHRSKRARGIPNAQASS
jgi:hypothetical protein